MEKMGRFVLMGWDIEAVNVPCAPGAEADAPKVLVEPPKDPPKRFPPGAPEVEVPRVGALLPKSEPPRVDCWLLFWPSRPPPNRLGCCPLFAGCCCCILPNREGAAGAAGLLPNKLFVGCWFCCCCWLPPNRGLPLVFPPKRLFPVA